MTTCYVVGQCYHVVETGPETEEDVVNPKSYHGCWNHFTSRKSHTYIHTNTLLPCRKHWTLFTILFAQHSVRAYRIHFIHIKIPKSSKFQTVSIAALQPCILTHTIEYTQKQTSALRNLCNTEQQMRQPPSNPNPNPRQKKNCPPIVVFKTC